MARDRKPKPEAAAEKRGPFRDVLNRPLTERFTEVDHGRQPVKDTPRVWRHQ